MSADQRRAVSISTAASMYGLTDYQIRRAIDTLQLPAKKVGGRIVIGVDDLGEWFERQDDAR